jgi:hypothetical protein
VVPADDCTCGVYCYWTVEDLVHEDGRYTKEASEIVAVVLLYGRTIDGDNGTRAKAARIVAYWCAEDKPKLARACAASAPEAQRYFDRDVMVHLHECDRPTSERN